MSIGADPRQGPRPLASLRRRLQRSLGVIAAVWRVETSPAWHDNIVSVDLNHRPVAVGARRRPATCQRNQNASWSPGDVLLGNDKAVAVALGSSGPSDPDTESAAQTHAAEP